ncbi:MAG TPA: prenyltransferase, partial [Phycisphaerae bacterium]|nr:prenyltransferase [Phycisphaerae bacterium]
MHMTETKRSLPASWCRLLRLPNLLTVPGDPIVGFALAAGALGYDSAICAVVSLCLYCAGLIINDIVDRKEDGIDRPGRPIPSGEISITAAAVVATILVLSGISLAWMISTYTAIIAGLIAITVIIYNLVGKKLPILGPLNMGLCRALSVYMGCAAVGIEANYTAA